MSRIAFGVLLGSLSVSLFGVEKYLYQKDSLQDLYPFLIMDESIIQNAHVLDPLFEQLSKLESGADDVISILQIGDSHIQAGSFSEIFRKGLQSQFGHAGRGLVFPYRLARTNGPNDLDITSNKNWISRRNAVPGNNIPTGISGFSIKTNERNAWLKVGLRQAGDSQDYFDRISLFLGNPIQPASLKVFKDLDSSGLEKPSPKYTIVTYVIRKGDNLGSIAARHGVTISQLKSWNDLRSDRILAGQKLIIRSPQLIQSVWDRSRLETLGDFSHHSSGLAGVLQADLPQPVNTCILGFSHDSLQPEEWLIQGISLERKAASGVIYHMAAVNGAQFQSFILAENFIQQVEALSPKCVILSLGTNESMEPNLDTVAFRISLEHLIDSLQCLPSSPLLLMTLPGDNLIRRKHPNPQVSVLRSILMQIALDKGIAWWDLFQVMGGERSVEAWYRAGLAASDRLHMTRKGYELQASLFLSAFLNAYKSSQYELE